MKRILLVKTSSLGDVIHLLPALTDAVLAHPDLRFDWIVEEGFAEIPTWHPAVDKIIPVALRRWRKAPWQTWRSGQWQNFKINLRERTYDKVIDAQGLIKSAFVARAAHGPRYGFDKYSAREPLASYSYAHKIPVVKGTHAITRLRELFAKIFDYPVPEGAPNYGLDLGPSQLPFPLPDTPYLVFLHGTTWTTKHWPESYWQQLVSIAFEAGTSVLLPWGNEIEKARAEGMAKDHPNVTVLPKLNLRGITEILGCASGVVAVDTGLSHLAAALETPCVSLYGPTDPGLTGALGKHTLHLKADFSCAPCLQRECSYKSEAAATPACFTTLPAAHVWQQLQTLIQQSQLPCPS